MQVNCYGYAMSGALVIELTGVAKAAVRHRRESLGMSQQDAAAASIERLARGEEPVEAVPERPAVYGSTPDGRGLSDRELELIDAAVKAALKRIRGEQ